jgi:hypothetical protein
MTPELALALLLAAIGIIQAIGLWVLSGLRTSARDLWQALTALNTTLHGVETRVAILETHLERRQSKPRLRRRKE